MFNTFVLILSWFVLGLAIMYFVTTRRWINRKIKQIEDKKEELLEIIDSSSNMIDELNNLSDYIVNQIDEKNMQLSTIYREVEEKLKKYDHITKEIKNPGANPKIIIEQKTGTKEHAQESGKGLDKSTIYHKILDLSNQGVNVNDIAKQLNIGKGEIQLILGINK